MEYEIAIKAKNQLKLEIKEPQTEKLKTYPKFKKAQNQTGKKLNNLKISTLGRLNFISLNKTHQKNKPTIKVSALDL